MKYIFNRRLYVHVKYMAQKTGKKRVVTPYGCNLTTRNYFQASLFISNKYFAEIRVFKNCYLTC